MANDTFATFQELTALQSNDYLVGYRNLTETKIGYTGLINTFVTPFSSDNQKINSIYSTVNVNSAGWEESAVIAPLQSASANWDSTYTTVNSISSLVSLSSVQTENILVIGNNVNLLSAVELGSVSLASPVSAFVVQINGVNYRLLAYQ